MRVGFGPWNSPAIRGWTCSKSGMIAARTNKPCPRPEQPQPPGRFVKTLEYECIPAREQPTKRKMATKTYDLGMVPITGENRTQQKREAHA